MTKPWYERDDFWATMKRKLFAAEQRREAPKETGQIISLLKITPGARILDLCCGTGRHSLELSKRGYNVTAVDRTAHYLEEASGNAEKKKLRIEFVRSDMRVFRRKAYFDAAINMYTSFGYFKDIREDKQVLRNVYFSLKKGGKLLIEIMGREILKRIFPGHFFVEDNGIFFLEERKVDPGWNWMKNRWIMLKNNKPREYVITHRIYSAPRLSSLFREAGFREIRTYGSLNGAPYGVKARRLVVVGEK